MLYKNKKTGAIVDMGSNVSGAWEPIEASKTEKPVKKKKTKKSDVK